MSLTVSLAGTASYMPANVVPNSFFLEAGAKQGGMFKGSRTRHHVAEGETATDMIERATANLAASLNLDVAKDVDLILTNVTCLDMPFTGVGATAAHRIGARPKQILDVHNAGCVSFVYMMSLARSLMQATDARTAMICNVQNAGGRVFGHPGNRSRAQSAVPGDGCGVGYLVAGDESPILTVQTRSHGKYADDMKVVSDDGGSWWDPRETPMYVDFDPNKILRIVGRGNQIVPEVIREACADADVTPSELDMLITNQPNPIFLRNWREALQLPVERHVDTFEDHGNLFGAAIPIAFERAVQTGALKKDSMVALGGFSHAGDYSAAAIVHWQAGQ